MKARYRLGIVLAALSMHLLAPLAAYASMKPVAVFNDFCSVVVKPARTPDRGSDFPVPPASPAHKHLAAHCPMCAGGAGAAAILPAAQLVVPVVGVGIEPYFAAPDPAFRSSPPVLPPPRGPPSILFA